MSMKRILGMILASRMADRGMRGGRGRGGLAGGGLGGLAAAGLLGGRRGGLGRKAGLAALGYMAYRAYQDHQARSGTSQHGASAGNGHQSSSTTGQSVRMGGGGSEAGLTGMLGGLARSVSDAFGGAQSDQTAASGSARGAETTAPKAASSGGSIPTVQSADDLFSPEDQRAAEAISEDTALLLLRGMITAANADGVISPEERSRIMSQAADADRDDLDTLERELANPRPLDELLGQIRDKETAEEFYLASRLAVDTETEPSRSYFRTLRERLGLAEQEAAEIDAVSSARA